MPLRAWLVALASLGAGAIFLSTARYGPGLTPDSANYFSAARSIVAGDGVLDVVGEPLAHFPPVLPSLLALLAGVGVEPATASRILNALCFALVVAATGSLTHRVTGNTVAAVSAAGFLLLSAPSLDAFSQALSEAPFVAALACVSLTLVRFAEDPRDGSLLPLALTAALVPMTRYVGVVTIPVVALTIASVSARAGHRRWRAAARFTAIACLPLLLWLTRNVWLTGTLTGRRSASTATPISVLRGFVASAADWVVPWDWLMSLQRYSDEPWALLVFFAAAIAVAGWLANGLRRWWVAPATDHRARAVVMFLALWVAAYSAFLCLTAMLVSFNPIEPRFLVPILFPSVILAAAGLAPAGETAGSTDSRGPDGAPPEPSATRRVAVATSIVVAAVLLAGRSTSLILQKRAEGAGGYATAEWQESPLIAALEAEPPPDDSISNGADVLFLVFGRRYAWVPRVASDNQTASLAAAMRRGDPVTVVWFEGIGWRPYLLERDRLLALGDFEQVRAAADGAVYVSRDSSR